MTIRAMIDQRIKRIHPEQTVQGQLYQAIWEASQWMTVEQLRSFCERVISEIEQDQS